MSYFTNSAAFIFLSMSLLFANSNAFAQTESSKDAKKADIRLLIDISGSMKKNDPANLRIPAVSLLSELIPDGDKAGVWTFGQWVNNLVKHRVVDDAWRKDAKELAKKINSVALHTNIGGVLEKAAYDFYKNDEDFTNTHFILLTDGMVDIDKDQTKNQQERERILSNVLTNFKARGAKVHAISLSNNADHSLMEKLAVHTGGKSAVVETAEELMKFFVQALDQAVPSEQVPIQGNEFAIDSSIEEFTALIFRKEGSLPTEIIAPDDTVYAYGKARDDVKWFQDRGYDLVTIRKPYEGAWTIKAELQPESRVTVVSNLQLQVSKLPTNFFAGDHLGVDVSFVEDGKLLIDPEFLSLLDIQLQLKTEEGRTASKSMSDSLKPPADGVFRDAITKLTKIGQYEVNVLVDGKTFQRSKRQIVNLRAPFDFEFSVKTDKAIPYYELVVTPLNDKVSLDDTNVFVRTKFPDSTTLINALELQKDKGRWQLQILPDKGDGTYEIAVRVKSQTLEDREFEFKPNIFEAEFPIPSGAATKIVSVNYADPETESVSESLLEQAPEEELNEPAPPEPEAKSIESAEVAEVNHNATDDTIVEDQAGNHLWWYISTAVAALSAAILGLVYFLLKRKKQKSDNEPGEILSDEDIEDIETPPVEEAPLFSEKVLQVPDEQVPIINEEPDNDDLDFTESPASETQALATELENSVPYMTEQVADTELEFEEAAIDLSADELSNVLDDLDQPPQQLEVQEESDEDDIAQAIEEAADEPEEPLPEEIEKALDINDDEDEDDDEEFNLEDFDIGDTDDLPDPDPEDKPKT